jgi:hypothetical protein
MEVSMVMSLSPESIKPASGWKRALAFVVRVVPRVARLRACAES